MPRLQDIVRFDDDTPPEGETPWVVPPKARKIEVVAPDPRWPRMYEDVAARLREALGPRALDILHVGSTSVPGLAAKPVIDVDLIVADPAREEAWLPALLEAGFILTVREPWWHEHRVLTGSAPRSNVHVFGPDAPEPWKHRIFRDHLRRDPRDRDLYGAAKMKASAHSNECGGETVMDYNRRKQATIREIYARAFAQAGLVDPVAADRPR